MNAEKMIIKTKYLLTLTMNNKHIIYKYVILATQVSNKIYKPTLYKKTINNLIYLRHWKKTIEEKIQNVKNYYI